METHELEDTHAIQNLCKTTRFRVMTKKVLCSQKDFF